MENEIYQKIKNNPEIGIDNLVLNTEIQSSQLASVLLNLELERAIESMPGKRYKVVD